MTRTRRPDTTDPTADRTTHAAVGTGPGTSGQGAAAPRPALDSEARLRALHARLTAAITELTHGDAWQRMLHTAARLPTYSPHNILLITSQCPQASAVAGFHTWKQLGRTVRKGEKGLAILAPVHRVSTVGPQPRAAGESSPTTEAAPTTRSAPSTEPSRLAGGAASSGDGSVACSPDAIDSRDGAGAARRVAGFRVVHVFDISQTDGPELPEPPRPQLLAGAAPAGLLDGLTRQVDGHGFRLVRQPIDVTPVGAGLPNGITDYSTRTVTVRPDLSDAQAVKTLAHELGHVLLHAPGSRPSGLTRQQAEVEAESVAHIVMDAHGLDTSSYTVRYVAGWSGGDVELLARSAERVISTAHRILRDAPGPATVALPDRGLTRTRASVHDADRTERPAVAGPTALLQETGRMPEGEAAAHQTASVAVGPAGAAPPGSRDTQFGTRRRASTRPVRSSMGNSRNAEQGRLW